MKRSALFLFFFGEDDDPASFLVSLARRTVVLPKDAGRLELNVFFFVSPKKVKSWLCTYLVNPTMSAVPRSQLL